MFSSQGSGDPSTGTVVVAVSDNDTPDQPPVARPDTVEMLADTIQPFPTFSEIYVAALKTLSSEIAPARQPASAPGS